MPVLLLHFFKQRFDGCRISDVGRHNQRLDVWMRFAEAGRYFFQLVSAAGDKDDGFCAGCSEGGNETLVYV
jgi:hypothetical protein